MNSFKTVGDNVPHIFQQLFIVVDQGTWSGDQRVAVLSNKLRDSSVIMQGLMLDTCSRGPARNGHVQGNRLERAMCMFQAND
jgi:hypothetical protein